MSKFNQTLALTPNLVSNKSSPYWLKYLSIHPYKKYSILTTYKKINMSSLLTYLNKKCIFVGVTKISTQTLTHSLSIPLELH